MQGDGSAITPAAKTAVVVFELNEHRYALPLTDVREVLALPAIVPLPKAPTIVEGVVNIRGVVVPVMDIRARFRLPARPPHPADHLLVARAKSPRWPCGSTGFWASSSWTRMTHKMPRR